MTKPFQILSVIFAVIIVEAVFITRVPTTSATHNPPNAGSCNNIVLVSTTENPNCDSGTANLTTSYSATYHVQSLNGIPYTLAFNKESWFCTDPFPHDSNDPSRLACRKSLQTDAGSATLPGGSAVNITIPRQLDTASCGSVQTDLSFKVMDKNNNVICEYGTPFFTFGFSFCSTGKVCNKITATPTPSPKPSPKPTMQPTKTPTPTPTPIQKPSPTMTPVPTAMQSPTPSPIQQTPTPIQSTPTPTSVPGVVAEITPTPGQVVVNVNQNQQQQQTVTVGSSQPAPAVQQQVLAATVAPAPQAAQLPSTGANPEVFLAFLSLLPLGLKLKKMV